MLLMFYNGFDADGRGTAYKVFSDIGECDVSSRIQSGLRFLYCTSIWGPLAGLQREVLYEEMNMIAVHTFLLPSCAHSSLT